MSGNGWGLTETRCVRCRMRVRVRMHCFCLREDSEGWMHPVAPTLPRLGPPPMSDYPDGLPLGLLSLRTSHGDEPWAGVLAASTPVDAAALHPYDIAALFPLYVYPQAPPEGQMELGL